MWCFVYLGNVLLIRKLTLHNFFLSSVWYHIGTNHLATAVGSWVVFLWFDAKIYVYNIVKTNSKKYLFHNISMTYHVNLTKQELPWIRINYIIAVSIQHFYGFSAFVSKLFISNDFLILRSFMFADFAGVFGCC